MSHLNELKTNTPLVSGVSTILGLDEPDDGIVGVAHELHVQLDPWVRLEHQLPRQELPWAKTMFVAAGGAGFRSLAQIHNDSTDMIVVILAGSAAAMGGAGTAVQWSRTNLQATTDLGLVAQCRDGRYSRASVPGVRARSQNGVALPVGYSNGLFWDADSAASVLYHVPWDYLLRPGDTLSVFPAGDNIAIRANWMGYVRKALNRRELSP